MFWNLDQLRLCMKNIFDNSFIQKIAQFKAQELPAAEKKTVILKIFMGDLACPMNEKRSLYKVKMLMIRRIDSD